MKFFYLLPIFFLASKSIEDFCYNDNCSIRITSPLELCRRQFVKSDLTSVLDVNVGKGWDGLQNLPMEEIFLREYKTCRNTPDGWFLLPDGVHLTGKKHLEIDRMAKFYATWEDYPKSSINEGEDEISGSYDKIFLGVKEKFASLKASLLTTKLLYHDYTLVVTSPVLNPKFIDHLHLIHKAYVSGDLSLAQYHANLLVQSFGTHVVTSADLGARFEQNDYIDMNGNDTKGLDVDEIKAAAAKSFVETLFGVNSTLLSGKNVTEKTKKIFGKVLKYSEMRTFGGPNVGQIFDGVYEGVQIQVKSLIKAINRVVF